MGGTPAEDSQSGGSRRGAWWLLLVGALLVIVGVLLQAFSIVAYVRGAGAGALDVHTANSATVHVGELAIVVGAIWGWWRRWSAVALALAFLVLSALQLFLIGDTDEPGGWENGLHGLFALVLLLAAVVYAKLATDRLGLRRRSTASR